MAMNFLRNLLISSSVLLFFAGIAISDEYECVYTIYVRTGSIIKGGTDSTICLRLYDKYDNGIGIRNIKTWGGVMPAGHNYFERGNLDIFSGRGPCLSGPICAVNLTSDGSGDHHGWYVNYLEVTSTGPHVSCSKQEFTVEQWLALDVDPNELTAIRNYCKGKGFVESTSLPSHAKIKPGSGFAAE